MKDENPPLSELRQYLDVLASQFEAPLADREVVFKTCQLIAMWAADEKKPMPEDVFTPGLNDKIARLMLSSACVMAMRMATAPQVQQKQGPRIVDSKGRPAS